MHQALLDQMLQENFQTGMPLACFVGKSAVRDVFTQRRAAVDCYHTYVSGNLYDNLCAFLVQLV